MRLNIVLWNQTKQSVEDKATTGAVAAKIKNLRCSKLFGALVNLTLFFNRILCQTLPTLNTEQQ